MEIDANILNLYDKIVLFVKKERQVMHFLYNNKKTQCCHQVQMQTIGPKNISLQNKKVRTFLLIHRFRVTLQNINQHRLNQGANAHRHHHQEQDEINHNLFCSVDNFAVLYNRTGSTNRAGREHIHHHQYTGGHTIEQRKSPKERE